MVKTTVQIKDDLQRRVVIPMDIWNLLGLKKGDFIEIDIEKVEKKG